MTRDEAIACLIDWAGDWITQHSFSLMPVRAAAERAEYEEAKAALAEPVVTPQGRCQHQAADASLDCTMPAVLCEIHGGHDGCAAEIMRLQGDIAEHVNDYKIGAQDARDEIARALETEAERRIQLGAYHSYLQASANGFVAAATKIRDGSIRKWLPKENG